MAEKLDMSLNGYAKIEQGKENFQPDSIFYQQYHHNAIDQTTCKHELEKAVFKNRNQIELVDNYPIS